MKSIKLIALAAILFAGIAYSYNAVASSNAPAPKAVPIAATKKKATVNMCKGNELSKFIVVSISQWHMWACEGSHPAYDSAVVTGDMNIAANLTPVGTYKIYAKETDRYLKGSDEKGSWNVHVDYWMPFLDNQYGTYGFHDADWRKQSDFGKISPYSSEASHGCVELPTQASKWVYDWSPIGTTIEVKA